MSSSSESAPTTAAVLDDVACGLRTACAVGAEEEEEEGEEEEEERPVPAQSVFIGKGGRAYDVGGNDISTTEKVYRVSDRALVDSFGRGFLHYFLVYIVFAKKQKERKVVVLATLNNVNSLLTIMSVTSQPSSWGDDIASGAPLLPTAAASVDSGGVVGGEEVSSFVSLEGGGGGSLDPSVDESSEITAPTISSKDRYAKFKASFEKDHWAAANKIWREFEVRNARLPEKGDGR